jgi:hypothetical protein
MNINPRGNQKHLHTTVIPVTNPPSKPGHADTQGRTQEMNYPDSQPDPKLQGQPKGIKAVLQKG